MCWTATKSSLYQTVCFCAITLIIRVSQLQSYKMNRGFTALYFALFKMLCTHYNGATSCPAIDALVAEVEDQHANAIKERKHTNAYKELCRRGEVALQKSHCCSAIAKWNAIWVGWQPVGMHRGRHCQRAVKWLLFLASCVISKKKAPHLDGSSFRGKQDEDIYKKFKEDWVNKLDGTLNSSSCQ